ncbi:MAG: GNAT family N-acetyltransferase [Gammaproteobacteria bacterium]|nr:GNAT family N-acetyltransferase [Gammaproteobacteria bacterium]
MILKSERLRLRRLSRDDVDFILAVTNDKQWLTFIGDRGIHNNGQASQYITVASDSFAAKGYGLWLVEAIDTEGDQRIGLCGFIRRPFLSCPDLGYAFLPRGRGNGYASEAVNLVLSWAAAHTSERQVSAICRPDNLASLAVLQRAGFKRIGQLFQPQQLPHDFFLRPL